MNRTKERAAAYYTNNHKTKETDVIPCSDSSHASRPYISLQFSKLKEQ